MKIPTEFTLYCNKIDVLIDNERMNDLGCLGTSEINKSRITISDEHKGLKLNQDIILDTFYHEKVHMILDTMGEYDLSGDERFVEIFSKLLRQSDETSYYN